MSDWRDALKCGAVTCRVLQAGAVVADFTPTAADQLWAPIRIDATGAVARGEFAESCQRFVDSGGAAGQYEGEACETIVKFGAAIQFRETFVVEFRRSDARAGFLAKLRATWRRRRPGQIAERVSLALAVALVMLSSGARAETERPWRLWVFEPDAPGRLERCATMAAAPPASGIAFDGSLTIEWREGQLVQQAAGGARQVWSPLNSCFALTVGAKTIAAGAIVPAASARLLRSPTLVLRSRDDADPLQFELAPSFPADRAQATPGLWREAFAPLSVKSAK